MVLPRASLVEEEVRKRRVKKAYVASLASNYRSEVTECDMDVCCRYIEEMCYADYICSFSQDSVRQYFCSSLWILHLRENMSVQGVEVGKWGGQARRAESADNV